MGPMRWLQWLEVPDGFDSHTTYVDGAKLCWIERPGQADERPPVLLIPGVGMTFRAYAWVLPRLATTRRVLVVDPPGCGDSDALEGSMDADSQARHLAKWLRANDIQRVHVVGHSLGAVLAARLGAALPDAVASLTLLSPSPDGGMPRMWQHLAALLRGAVHEAPRTLVQATRDYVTAGPAVMVGFHEMLGSTTESLLAGVRAPVTIARGRHDRVVTERWCAALAAASGAALHTISGAAHGLPQQRPQVVAGVIRSVAAHNDPGRVTSGVARSGHTGAPSHIR